MQELETELNKVYDVFFNTLDIDKTTGIVNNIKSNKRFATKIAIGKKLSFCTKKNSFC